MVTERDVYVYRELYYEHIKPLLRLGVKAEQIENICEDIFKYYGWSFEKFKDFSVLDLIQRLKELRNYGNKVEVEVYFGGEILTLDQFNEIPELRCPIRSEQKNV